MTAADSDVYRVTILVTDVNEAPSMPMEARGGININGPLNINRYDEGGTGMVATYSTTGGDVGATVMWSLAGDDMDDFSIDANGVLTFNMTPDYEDPMDSNRDNIYAITVEADDGTNVDSQFVTVTVGNVTEDGAVTDEDETVTLSSMQPVVGTELTATLTDTGSGITGATWQWANSDASDGTFTDIPRATSMNYTPVDPDDVGMYLRATVSYTDTQGPKQKAAVTANAVAAEGGLLATYDSDSDGGISKAEFLAALDEYFDERIEKDTLLEVLDFYFDS